MYFVENVGVVDGESFAKLPRTRRLSEISL